MPQIKTFYSHTHAAGVGRTIAYPCFSEPFSCGLPAPIRNFSPTILAQLHAASSLETIQYPEEVENEWCGEDDAYWGSRACSEKRGRVTLIRTYTFSNEVFTHCRSYAAHHSSINGGFTHRIEDMWEEHTDYAGLHVPADILSSVCTAAGLNVAWLKPGRGLTMPTEAWKVLRMWKVINKQDLPNSEEEVPEEMLVPAKSIEGEC